MIQFTATDPNFESRIRESFARQRLMQTIDAQILDVTAGHVAIELPFRYDLTQQNGYLHAGIVAAVVDSACGYAAMTLTPAGAEILSVEFKINLLSPAKGERFLAHGNVIRAGRTLTVCEGQAIAISEGQEKQIAAMMATMFVVN